MARELTPLSEAQLFSAYGMDKHQFRQYDADDGYGTGCSCGREYGHCIRAGLSCLKHGAAWPSGLPGRCEVGRALDAGTGAE